MTNTGKLFTHTIRNDFPILIFGSIISFFLASVLMSGWPTGLHPNFSYPYSFTGDSVGAQNLIQRALDERWFFQNWRTGYPFGSNHLDFPSSDTGTIFALKVIGVLAGNSFVVAYNLFYLITFSLSFSFTYIFFRRYDISKPYSFVAGLVYAFASFHFQRIGHYFYISYFIIPLAFYLLGSLFTAASKRQRAITNISLATCSCFGAYYSIFLALLFLIAGFWSWFRTESFRLFSRIFFGALAVLFGLLINISPSLIYRAEQGKNVTVAARGANESEIYGLKITQMLLPRIDHRAPILANISKSYASQFPLVNENHTANLGLIGSVGFLFSLVGAFILLSGKRTPPILALSFCMIFFGVLFTTVGGGASILSLLVSSQVRGWNRISIVILFLTIYVFFYVFEMMYRRITNSYFASIFLIFSSVSIAFISLYDQTTSPCIACNKQLEFSFEDESDLVHKIENALPQGSAILQLPYLSFPESGGLHSLGDYDLLKPYLLSKHLRLSFGGMRGRDGDNFFARLASEPMDRQIEVASRLGFSAISVDRRGYKDSGAEIITLLNASPLISPVNLKSSNKTVVLYKIKSHGPLIPDGTSSEKIYAQSGMIKYDGLHYSGSTLAELPLQVGVFKGTTIVGNGNAGALFYGPYRKIRPGNYRLRVFGRAPTSPGSWIDVVDRQGSVQFGKFSLYPFKQAEVNILIDELIKIDQGAVNLEVRIHVEAGSDIEVSGYELLRN